MELLSVKNVSFFYPDSKIQALDKVSFTLDQGEYLAVLGANGSGKSTLARLISGFLDCTVGSIELVKSAASVPAGIVFQSPREQIIAGITEKDTAFGPENLHLDKTQIDLRAAYALKITGLLDKADKKTSSLSLGQKQKLALAGILALEPELLVLDEALSMVDPAMRSNLLDFLDEQHARGQTIVHITHDIDEALRADKIIALHEGGIIFDGSQTDFQKQSELVNRLFGNPLKKIPVGKTGTKTAKTSPSLHFENIDFFYEKDKPVFSGFSLQCFGELTAVMGQSGSGKSTLFELAAGLLVPQGGRVFAQGQPVLALQEAESALFEEFAADDVAFGPKNQGLRGFELKEQVRRAMDTCALPFDVFANRRTASLSGGERRKLALAGIIALKSDVYLFDEPTAGLDPAGRKQVLKTLAALAADGKTVIFSTHRQEEADFAGRCIVFDAHTEHVSVSYDNAEYGGLSTNIEKTGLSAVEPASVKLLDNLRRQSAGLYEKRKSPIHRLKPVLKWLLFLCLFMPSFIIQNVTALYIFVGLNLAYLSLSAYSPIKFLRTFMRFLPWLAFFAVLQIVFFPPAAGEKLLWAWRIFTLSPSKIRLVLLTLLHVAAALPVLTGFMYSTDESELLEGLKVLFRPLDKIGIQSKYLVLTAGLVFRFIPLLADEAAQIIKVQSIRGGLKRKKGLLASILGLLPLFVPLMLQTIKRSEALADTLDARYF